MLASLLRIVALIRKELLAILKDPRSRFIIFIPPVLQCLVFGYVVNYDSARFPMRARSGPQRGLARASWQLDGSGVFIGSPIWRREPTSRT